MEPLCEPPAWSYMSCDGGLWTLAVVLPFSADFMPLLSFTLTQNKQHRACLLWEQLSLPPNHFLQLLHFPLSSLSSPLYFWYSNFLNVAFLFFLFFPLKSVPLALTHSAFSLLFSFTSCFWMALPYSQHLFPVNILYNILHGICSLLCRWSFG